MKYYINNIVKKLKMMSKRNQLINENRSMVFDATEYSIEELKALMAA